MLAFSYWSIYYIIHIHIKPSKLLAFENVRQHSDLSIKMCGGIFLYPAHIYTLHSYTKYPLLYFLNKKTPPSLAIIDQYLTG